MPTTAATPTAPPGYAGDTVDQWRSWSEPDSGITVRIEYVFAPRDYDRGAVYLRLKNVSDNPRRVPAGEIRSAAWTRCFELYRWDGEAWRPMFWPAERYSGSGFRSEPQTLELLPGQSTLLGLTLGLPDALMAASHFKIAVRLPRIRTATPEGEDAEPRTTLFGDEIKPTPFDGPPIARIFAETPPFPTTFTDEMDATRLGRYDIPDVLPFEVSKFQGGAWSLSELNGPPDPVILSDLLYGNNLRRVLLRLYPAEHIRAAMDRLLADETQDIHWRLMIAIVAIRNGSEAGQALIASVIDRGDYQEVRSALLAVRVLLGDDEPSPWAIQTAIEAIEDDRVVKGDGDGQTRVSYLACNDFCDVVWPLGRGGHVEAVPALIRRVEATGGRESGPLMALGFIGDKRAIPVLLPLLEARLKAGWNPTHGKPTILSAIIHLKATEAVPMLLDHINLRGIPEALGRIGDRRAVPELRTLADAGRFDAILALCQLGDRDAYETLMPEITNPGRSEHERIDAMQAANDPPDPRMVPHLVALIRDTPSGMTADLAIRELAKHTGRAAVVGLIDSFDVDFNAKQGWKPAYEARMYRLHIADALHRITGESFGNNPGAWRTWWQDTGRHDPRFQ